MPKILGHAKITNSYLGVKTVERMLKFQLSSFARNVTLEMPLLGNLPGDLKQ